MEQKVIEDICCELSKDLFDFNPEHCLIAIEI